MSAKVERERSEKEVYEEEITVINMVFRTSPRWNLKETLQEQALFLDKCSNRGRAAISLLCQECAWVPQDSKEASVAGQSDQQRKRYYSQRGNWGQARSVWRPLKKTLVFLKEMGDIGGFWVKWHVPIYSFQDYAGCRVKNRLGERLGNLLPESRWEMVVALTKKEGGSGGRAMFWFWIYFESRANGVS